MTFFIVEHHASASRGAKLFVRETLLVVDTHKLMPSPYTSCDYLSLKGVCGKRCYGGRCSIHRNRKSLVTASAGVGLEPAAKLGTAPIMIAAAGVRETDRRNYARSVRQ